MSRENVDVLRAFYTAWDAGDMDALRELHDSSVIMHHPSGWPEPGPKWAETLSCASTTVFAMHGMRIRWSRSETSSTRATGLC